MSSGNHVGGLRDRGGVLAHRLGPRQLDPPRLAEVATDETGDPRRHRGREQHGLPVVGRALQDRVDVLGETHVEHLVGLVQHDHAQRRQVERATGQVVERPSRGGHDDVHPGLQAAELTSHWLPTVDGDDPDSEAMPVAVHRLAHLRREFTGGHEHECARRDSPLLDVRNAVQHRQRERRRLTGARGRLADDVGAVEQRRNRGPLDGRRLLVAEIRQRRQQLRPQPELSEGGGRTGVGRLEAVVRFRRDGDHEKAPASGG